MKQIYSVNFKERMNKKKREKRGKKMKRKEREEERKEEREEEKRERKSDETRVIKVVGRIKKLDAAPEQVLKFIILLQQQQLQEEQKEKQEMKQKMKQSKLSMCDFCHLYYSKRILFYSCDECTSEFCRSKCLLRHAQQCIICKECEEYRLRKEMVRCDKCHKDLCEYCNIENHNECNK